MKKTGVTQKAFKTDTNRSLINDPVLLVKSYPRVPITVDCVIFGFDAFGLKVLLIRSDLEMYKDLWTLLGDFAKDHEDLDKAAYRVLK